MILSTQFVCLHVQKTGGQWLAAVLREHAPPDWNVRVLWTAGNTHGGLSDIPAEYNHLPVYAVVRNPWDYYVSHFSMWAKACLEPDGWVQRQLREHPGVGLAHADAAWNRLLQRTGGGIEGFRRAMLDEEAYCTPTSPLGRVEFSLTRTLRGMGILTGIPHVGRFERLAADTLGFLEQTTDVPPRLREALQAFPPVNVGVHGRYQDYYDEETRALVAHVDAQIICGYRYTFDGVAFEEAV